MESGAAMWRLVWQNAIRPQAALPLGEPTPTVSRKAVTVRVGHTLP